MPTQVNATDSVHAAHGVAGMIIVSLVVIFAMHFLGFRFVVAAGAGVGR
jgi:hypothetical protein